MSNGRHKNVSGISPPTTTFTFTQLSQPQFSAQNNFSEPLALEIFFEVVGLGTRPSTAQHMRMQRDKHFDYTRIGYHPFRHAHSSRIKEACGLLASPKGHAAPASTHSHAAMQELAQSLQYTSLATVHQLSKCMLSLRCKLGEDSPTGRLKQPFLLCSPSARSGRLQTT